MASNRREVDPPEESEAPPELRATFWTLVVLFNIAILAIAVGAMLLGFRGQWTPGGPLLVAGILAFAFGVYRVRNVQNRLERDEESAAET